MPTTIYEGHLTTPTGRFCIVAARFNSVVVDDLISGAVDGLKRFGVREDAIDVVRVPGSFEIPLIARSAADSKKYAAVLCLGAIIQGETDHYDYVCNSTASGIMQASMATGVPVIFGILTCDTLEQAVNRAGGKSGNKGFDAAATAVEMVNLMRTWK